ncbi:glycosyltransferase family 4 protein [Brevibacillus humidisoli]|uniref:glycosyltransferase family 4 protein n=1 Tax=Brevibacillus humidisoli TaxID=2895522 RepID=UPI001E31D2A8|nr:glycosyltransferase family 4 protein [Brevibacillus humidisoli]UFJ39148.1 glycosyltransferase family 4 protein [Brevibacillus humidisoli]
MKQRKLAQVGVYPPPVGGISVHIQRLCRALDARGIPVTIYDNTTGEKDRDVKYTGKIETWALRYLFGCREDVIHVHFLRWQVRLLLSLLALRGKRVIFTVHNMRGEEQPLSWIKRLIVKVTSRLAYRFIVVNPEFVDRLAACGVDPEKIVFIPPFIHGQQDEIPISPEVASFLASSDTKLLLANGAVGTYHKGVDLYGIDLIVDLAERLAGMRRDVRIIYCVTHVADPVYYEKLQQQVSERGLTEVFCFLHAPPEYQTLLKRSAVFLRPTNSDSYGISVYEALHSGVPVVASDADIRPPQTVLFADRDLDDFLAKTVSVLDGERALHEQGDPVPDYAEQIIALYGLAERAR